MPDLLLELLCEEIPARMQARAADDLKRLVTGALVDAGLTYEGATAFATPRRLALNIAGLPARQPDTKDERKGPRVGAPEKALEGFLRAAGLTSVDEASIVKDEKKGDYYLAIVEKPGRASEAVIGGVIPDIIRNFPWPKSMRWGAGDLRWVRPLQSILCTFGPETEDPIVVEFEVGGVKSGNTTFGHRFMAPDPITVRRFDDYVASLDAAFVTLDATRRADTIHADAKNLAFAQGLELVEDAGLLAEVAGLVEHPVVLMGTFDEAFLYVPPEVLTTSMKSHQKCFSLRDPETGNLANKFIMVANLKADDGGKAIVAGNERVIAARLSDARFFWEQDLKTPLEDQLEKLKDITFHEKLGTQFERVERLRALSREIAPLVGADPDLADRAAQLCKADLVTEMVGEFPELQGLMGKYYALKAGEDPSVATAIEEHYRPQGPSDAVPSDPVAIAVALADKLDTLVGFWHIDEIPTGSRDPFALRRAALGVVRLLHERGLNLSINWLTKQAINLGFKVDIDGATPDEIMTLCYFFEVRVEQNLRDNGKRHDLVAAVRDNFSLVAGNPILDFISRVEALGAFLETDDGANLLAGIKRATNILRIEEKKDACRYTQMPDADLLQDKTEIALNGAIADVDAKLATSIEKEDFAGALSALASLRAPVDAFFEDVKVNADDMDLRATRLRLLNRIRETSSRIADFSKIEG